ncbi:hypothetical protein GGR52DRAFT_538033 [Hypoxylon sp. FL1284]|nr:hypothetical protein GGR52DRAFT_538033 [Hypoxylon sp. FL1284]
MASRHKQPTPTEAGSGSDVGFGLNSSFKATASMPQAMERIDKWKSQRSRVQKEIDKDYTEKLTVLKSEIEAQYQGEAQKMSNHSKQQLERLIAALEKRAACEEKINKRINEIREDCAHLAMLMDAIYAGRKEAAAQTAKAINDDMLKG